MKALSVLLNLALTAGFIWLSYTLLTEVKASGPHPVGVYVAFGISLLWTVICAFYLLASLREQQGSPFAIA